jgi:hypothetical protein
MIGLSRALSVFAYTELVEMRKSFNTPGALVEEQMSRSRTLFVRRSAVNGTGSMPMASVHSLPSHSVPKRMLIGSRHTTTRVVLTAARLQACPTMCKLPDRATGSPLGSAATRSTRGSNVIENSDSAWSGSSHLNNKRPLDSRMQVAVGGITSRLHSASRSRDDEFSSPVRRGECPSRMVPAPAGCRTAQVLRAST